jgi:hypothetical protein
MALTPGRWIAAFVAGALLVCCISVTPNRRTGVRDPGEVVLENNLRAQDDHVWQLTRRLRSAQLADSVKAVASRQTPAPFRQLMDAAMPGALRADLNSLGDRALAAIGTPRGNGVDVAFVYDTARKIRGAVLDRWSATADYILPALADGRCTVILRVPAIGRDKASDQRTMYHSVNAPLRLLGPCAYYAAFGMPGSKVNDWLRNGAWGFVGDGSWTDRAPQYISYLDSSSWPYVQLPLRADLLPFMPSAPFLDLPIRGLACLRDDLAACRDAAMPTPREYHSAFNGNLMMSSASLDHYRYGLSAVAFGDRSSMLMAGLVRALGRDGFRRFWTSGDSVSAALQSVAGKPLDTWAHEWMVEQYGPAPKETVPGGWALGWALLLIASSIYFALRFSSRRVFA